MTELALRLDILQQATLTTTTPLHMRRLMVPLSHTSLLLHSMFLPLIITDLEITRDQITLETHHLIDQELMIVVERETWGQAHVMHLFLLLLQVAEMNMRIFAENVRFRNVMTGNVGKEKKDRDKKSVSENVNENGRENESEKENEKESVNESERGREIGRGRGVEWKLLLAVSIIRFRLLLPDALLPERATVY